MNAMLGAKGTTSLLYGVLAILGAAALAVILLVLLTPSTAKSASSLPTGFQVSTPFSGLASPTNIEFAKDGRVFVAEKRGTIKTYDNLSDTTATIAADLRLKVFNASDRGLLGLALDPNFPTNPYIYALYTHDAPIGGTAPAWNDVCPDPPGATKDGCVVSGRLSRLQIDPATNTMTGTEKVLIEDWCQQYSSHSIGDLAFGPDGALYVSGGEGASFTFTDYGQGGGSAGSPTPKNPCGDPPGGVGGEMTAPTAEGGRLRSQDLQTNGDPVTLDGALLRVNPATGAAMPGNPLSADADPNARRIISYGHRNPFRFTLRPGTNEVWIGDVGGTNYDEINRIVNPAASTVDNFGWPCYEGAFRQPSFDNANLNICENLYKASNAHALPYYAYHRNGEVVEGDQLAGCNTGQTAIAALAFYEGGTYPASYKDALFFADYTRNCIWVMKKGANGLPDPTKIERFATDVGAPVDLESGPKNDLFYVDIGSSAVRRIEYIGTNQAPSAAATANPPNGTAPLTVNFDGTGSSDPDAGDTLSYAWDLDGDGAYDDSTSPQPTHTYDTAGSYQVGLKVTDSQGTSDTLDQPLTISVDTPVNDAPTATIGSPLASTTWKVGDGIDFSGSASDPQDGSLAASALSWQLIVHHCTAPDTCHEHPEEEFLGVDHGSFTAPDHEYPSYLELRLTATDSGGLKDTESVRLDPQSVELRFESDPAGLQVTIGEDAVTTPFSRTVIVGSKNSISAPSPQTLAGQSYGFSSWSDGGAQSHDIVAPSGAATYTATYAPTPPQDTTAPTVASVAPADGATGVPISTDAKVTFSEAMDATTIDATTFTLTKQGSTAPVAATVTYDGASNTATLDPSADLDYGATYTATVKGGANGAKDAAGNALAADKAWSFTTNDPPPAACTITGTSSGETLFGTEGPDVICGGGGNDTIKGLGGDDTLKGEANADKLFGGPGDDTLDGGLNPDFADFQESLVGVTASLVDNTATGDGSDTLVEVENLEGSYHNDTLTGSDANNTINGEGGNDTISGLGGADKTSGNAGSDAVRGGSDDDSVSGGSGADDLHGEDGDDSVNSQDGQSGNDSLDGGAHVTGDTKVTDTTERFIIGFEDEPNAPTVASVSPQDGANDVALDADVKATFSEAMDAATIGSTTFTLTKQGSTTPVNATVNYAADTMTATLNPDQDLASGIVYTATVKGGTGGVKDAAGNPLAQDKVWSFTPPAGACTITGTSSGETLLGTEGPDVICGGGGNDTIKGLGGDDVLKGAAGGDKLFGGAGDDTLDGGIGSDFANFTESVVGVTVSLVDNTATGDGSDTLVGIENIDGSYYADTLTGSDAANTINANSGNDTISGLGGADKPSGNTGNDAVRGGAGDDTVFGGSGADDLHGEDGDDSVNSKDGVSGNDSLDGGAHVNGDTAVTDATEKSIIGFP